MAVGSSPTGRIGGIIRSFTWFKNAIKLNCYDCNKSFFKDKGHYNWSIKIGERQFCSSECRHNTFFSRITVSCDNCGKDVLKTSSQISNTNHNFCCSSCAATYNNTGRIRTDESRGKTSLSLQKHYRKHGKALDEIECAWCGERFIRETHSMRKYCSISCRENGASKNLSIAIKKVVAEGRHKGWISRNILSYPEKFFRRVLLNNNLLDKCQINFPYKSYFLDFYFPERRIDLEIDGKQHKRLEQKTSDERRDKILIDSGIKVYRIPWKEINSDNGKKYIKNEIDKFLYFYFKSEDYSE